VGDTIAYSTSLEHNVNMDIISQNYGENMKGNMYLDVYHYSGRHILNKKPPK
jgi:hypothetical protein